jgi:hypothetical protein
MGACIFRASCQSSLEGDTVKCKSCGSDKQRKFTAEIAIHFPGLKNISKPHVLVYPEPLICLNCGMAEFFVPETELRALAKNGAAAAGGS